MDETTRFGREEVVFRHVSGSHDLTYMKPNSRKSMADLSQDWVLIIK